MTRVIAARKNTAILFFLHFPVVHVEHKGEGDRKGECGVMERGYGVVAGRSRCVVVDRSSGEGEEAKSDCRMKSVQEKQMERMLLCGQQ